jgi:hypothetical protein
MLRGSELIGRGELTVLWDRPDINNASFGTSHEGERVVYVGEWDERLALRESWKRPFRYAEDAKSGCREAAFQNVPSIALYRHFRTLSVSGGDKCPATHRQVLSRSGF